METLETKEEKRGDAERLSQNYEKMDEAGKEKLKQVADRILGIHEIVNGKAEIKF